MCEMEPNSFDQNSTKSIHFSGGLKSQGELLIKWVGPTSRSKKRMVTLSKTFHLKWYSFHKATQ